MTISTGVNVTKVNAYAVLSPPNGVSVSKAAVYAVLGPNQGVNTSKFVAYAVLFPGNFNAPVWGTVVFQDAVINNPYFQGWDLIPAATPTSYSIVSGSLPPGITLASVSGTDQGNISGTPTVLGSYTFTIRATNIYGTADKPVTMNVNLPSGGGGGSFVFIS
jgi:hypothetical protein